MNKSLEAHLSEINLKVKQLLKAKVKILEKFFNLTYHNNKFKKLKLICSRHLQSS